MIEHLYKGWIPYFSISGNTDMGSNRLIFPGSFNPIHKGHVLMAKIASETCPFDTDRKVNFEISVINVDKPPLSVKDISERIKVYKEALVENSDLWFTNAPTFIEKASIFKNCVFIVGLDTFLRVNDPKYYTNFEAGMDFLSKAARWFVFPRKKKDGTINVDNVFQDIKENCKLDINTVTYTTNYPEEIHNISSTAIRNGN